MSERPAAREAADGEMTWPLGAERGGRTGGSDGPTVVAVADLRGANAAAVLAAIRSAAEPPRLAALAAATNLSRPTIELIVDDLVASGLVAEVSPLASEGSSPGRPARRFAFQPAARYVVGIDVRAYATAGCVADLDGNVVITMQRRVRRDLTGRARANAVLSLVSRMLQEADVQGDRVCAATVGTPGWVQDNARVRYVDNLRDWADIDIAGELSDKLGCPVAVDNDANLAAVGEQWRGVGAGSSDLIFVLVGERVGAGIITGGRPVHGRNGAAGEIGFMVFPDGNKLAARSIGSEGSQRPGIDPGSVYSDADVVTAATRGERQAIRSLAAAGSRLAKALAPVLLALDPELVVVGSSLFGVADVQTASHHLLDAAERQSAALLVDPPRWQVSSLGEQAILTGAVRFSLAAVENVLSSRPTAL
jgi:predicted NBD/HSP70 family sugar kinase